MDRRRCAGPASCADLVVMTPSPRSPSGDPLLQPYRLKHLTLRNRILSTAHEPAYSEEGLPKERYRLYHAEKARRSEEHTYELKSLMRISYAVFCLNKKK